MPARETHWQSLSVLLLRCIEDLADWLRTIKKLKVTPGPAPTLQGVLEQVASSRNFDAEPVSGAGGDTWRQLWLPGSQ